MFELGIKKINKCIFPIGAVKISGAKQMNLAVFGTGFFINENGVFVLATHLLDNKQNFDIYRIEWLVETSPIKTEKIRILYEDKAEDILIGRVEAKVPTPYATLAKEEVPIGRNVCVAGYAHGDFRYPYYQDAMVVNNDINVTAHINNISRSYGGILLNEPGINGMSGGPVFDITGRVYGMHVITSNKQSRNLSVYNGLSIKSSQVIRFLEKADIIIGSNRQLKLL